MHPQNLMVLTWLKSGRELTPLDALNTFGCFRLSARIYDLRKDGWPIECERRAVTNDKVIGVYRMTTEESQWPNEL